MNINYGIFNEAYKMEGRFQPKEDLKTSPHSIELVAGQNDFAAATVLVHSDLPYSLQIGRHAWFTQRGNVSTIRMDCDLPLEVHMYHEQTHRTKHPMEYADALLPVDVKEYDADITGGVYLMVKTDKTTKAGSYHGKVRLFVSRLLGGEELVGEMDVTVRVINCYVRSGKDNRFYLDLWQHPSNIARHADVRLWSDEHFAVMENYLRALADLGQRALTIIVTEIPWSGQACCKTPETGSNIFEFSMIPVRKGTDGAFSYDFSLMQRYIDLAAKCGIRDEISLYGLINVWPSDLFPKIVDDYPDGVRVRYLDERTGCYEYMRTAADIDTYIRAIESYFVDTKQIDRVRVSADEPGDVVAFRESFDHLHATAPAFKFKTAINHIEFIDEFGEEFNDFAPYLHCVRDKFRELQEYKRTMPGKRFLWYTCCGPERPNYFLHSPLVETYLVGLLTSLYDMDGYLRWSFTVWTKNPMHDANYNIWDVGDMFIVYPGQNGKPILSLRYHALRRAIQFFELLKTYRARFGKTRTAALLKPIFPSDDLKVADTNYSLDYKDYEALRVQLLTALAK